MTLNDNLEYWRENELWQNEYVFHMFNDKFSFKLLKIDLLLYNSADETTFDPKYGVNAVVNYDGDVCKN